MFRQMRWRHLDISCIRKNRKWSCLHATIFDACIGQYHYPIIMFLVSIFNLDITLYYYIYYYFVFFSATSLVDRLRLYCKLVTCSTTPLICFLLSLYVPFSACFIQVLAVGSLSQLGSMVCRVQPSTFHSEDICQPSSLVQNQDYSHTHISTLRSGFTRTPVSVLIRLVLVWPCRNVLLFSSKAVTLSQDLNSHFC